MKVLSVKSRFIIPQSLAWLMLFFGTIFSSLAQSQGHVELDFGEPLQYDFGELVEGDSAVKVFTFINVGTVPVHFTEMQTTCSCTATDYPKVPVNPGERGVIKVEFDTNEKNGFYAKGVNLIYAGGEVNFVIYATVIAKKEGN